MAELVDARDLKSLAIIENAPHFRKTFASEPGETSANPALLENIWEGARHDPRPRKHPTHSDRTEGQARLFHVASQIANRPQQSKPSDRGLIELRRISQSNGNFATQAETQRLVPSRAPRSSDRPIMHQPSRAQHRDLKWQTDAFVEHYNHVCYHESFNSLAPADVYFVKADIILTESESISVHYQKPPLAALAAGRLNSNTDEP